MSGLSATQIEFFETNGFLVIPNFFSQDEAETLKAASHRLVDGMDLESIPKTKFVTGDRQTSANNDYFLSSGNKIHFFFEEDAFDAAGSLTADKHLSVNKIGHALHELVPEFKRFSHSERIKQIAKSLQYKDPRILQSMLIFKQPRIGGAVPSHQDSTFLYTQPLSAVGFWFALQDCTLENGCMYFAPGSHKNVPVWRRFVRRPDNTGLEFINIQNPIPEPHESEFVSAPVSAGSLVLIHGSVLHKSGPNRSDKSRWIYTFHVIEGSDAGCIYDEKNWLQPTDDMPLTKLYQN